MTKKFLQALTTVIMVAASLRYLIAQPINPSSVLANESALSYNKKYTLDTQAFGFNILAAQVNYGSATLKTSTFQDGTQATGSFTVASYTALSSATATDSLLVFSTSNLQGLRLSIPGRSIVGGLDFIAGPTSTSAPLSTPQVAASIAGAFNLAQNPGLGGAGTGPLAVASNVVGSSSVTFVANSYGAWGNAISLVSSSTNTISVNNLASSNSSSFSGGQDNAVLAINGIPLRANVNFFPASSNSNTASLIATAANANASLANIVTVGAAGAVLTATSNVVGLSQNFVLSSSLPTALEINGSSLSASGLMSGGTSPAWNLNSALINVPSNNFGLATQVLYTTSGASIGGLSAGTTYYIVPEVPGQSIELASSSAQALLGNGLVLTSSSTQLSADTFTLTPLAIAGTPGLSWNVSNDGINFSPLSVSSVTITSYTNPTASTIWNFGQLGFRYLQLQATSPTAGGLVLQTTVFGH